MKTEGYTYTSDSSFPQHCVHNKLDYYYYYKC